MRSACLLSCLLLCAALATPTLALTFGDLTALSALFLTWQPQLEAYGWNADVASACGDLFGTPPFNGIGCVDQRPWSLNLEHLGLQNPIPPQLALMDNLRGLSLAHNHITGSIPTEVLNMPMLIIIDFSHNMLSGSLPADFSPALLSFSVNNNNLAGTIPPALLALETIQKIDLGRCAFSGPLPTTWGSFLSYLDVTDNLLTGVLPTAIQSMPSYYGYPPTFLASDNLFTGVIPTTIFLNTNGLVIDLSRNRLDICGSYQHAPISQANFTCTIGNQWFTASSCDCADQFPVQCHDSIHPCISCDETLRPSNDFHCSSNMGSFFALGDVTVSTALTIATPRVVIFGQLTVEHGAQLTFTGLSSSLYTTDSVFLNGKVAVSLSYAESKSLKGKGPTTRQLLRSNADGGVSRGNSWALSALGCGYSIKAQSTENKYSATYTYRYQPWLICPAWHVIVVVLPIVVALLIVMIFYCYATKCNCVKDVITGSKRARTYISEEQEEDYQRNSIHHSVQDEDRPLLAMTHEDEAYYDEIKDPQTGHIHRVHLDTEPDTESEIDY